MRTYLSILAAAAIALAGCSKSQPAAPAAPQAEAIVQPGAPGQASQVVSKVPTYDDATYTQGDVEFMQGMIHHHSQALVMVRMIPTHTDTVQLLELGKKIDLSQSGEIQMMKDWLTARHLDVPMVMDDGSTMMGNMNMAPMPGMLTAEQMKALAAAHGHEFDQLFLNGMIQHHKGALSMVADLRNQPGGALEPTLSDYLRQVDTDQRMEIVRMYGLLGRKSEFTN